MPTIEQVTEIAQDTEGNSYLKNVSAKQGYVYDYTLKDNCPDEIKNVINMIINQPKQDDYLLDFEFRLSMLELGIIKRKELINIRTKSNGSNLKINI